MTKIDAMFIHVLVRRAGGGATPFTWEIHGAGTTPIDVSIIRYGSMQAAYEAGQAGLTALIASAVRKPSARNSGANDVRKLTTAAM